MSAPEILVCFDFEVSWGMPFEARYDLEASTDLILQALARHRARAVFFVVGELALAHGDLIGAIAEGGHELALHGWRHERFYRLDGEPLARVARGLEESAMAIESVTGKRPTGFRAPYLLAPSFYQANVYNLLAAQGYRWTSNRELRYVVELLRPDRLRTERPWRFVSSRPDLLTGPISELLRLSLNANAVFSRRAGRSIGAAYRWLRAGVPPFHAGPLLEIPLYSPLDCDLLGLPDPSSETPRALLQYTRYALETAIAQSGPLAMLTFHDWIIAGGNRLQLLDALLSFVAAEGIETIGVEERWSSLAKLADAAGRLG
jgi:peptidoglycan/xylan/chitin deacetylase (PgdA/CDA1 family)